MECTNMEKMLNMERMGGGKVEEIYNVEVWKKWTCGKDGM